MIVQTILFVLAGLGTIFAPQSYLAPMGITLDDSGTAFARVYGATVLMTAVITWLARDAAPSQALHAVVVGLFVGNALALIVTLTTILSGIGTTLAWVNIALFLLLAAGFAYFLRQPHVAAGLSK